MPPPDAPGPNPLRAKLAAGGCATCFMVTMPSVAMAQVLERLQADRNPLPIHGSAGTCFTLLGRGGPRRSDGVAVGAGSFGRSARSGAGGDRRWQRGEGGGAAIPGQRIVHLQGVGRPDVALERAARRGAQGGMGPQRLVFVDETGAATDMARRHGRRPRGQRPDGPIPHGHRKSTTLAAGLTNRGFVAPCVGDGAMGGAIFKAWTEQMPAPALRPGDTVITDDLAAHEVAGVRKAIEGRGAELLHLPGIMEQTHLWAPYG